MKKDKRKCSICGLTLPAGSYKLRKYHEGRCQQAAQAKANSKMIEKRSAERKAQKVPRNCKSCGHSFTPYNGSNLFCRRAECKRQRDRVRHRRFISTQRRKDGGFKG